MARPRSARVAQVKAALVARLQDGLVRPGERFLSTRAVAQRFGVSYETAHRLLGELTQEGRLCRRAASGSYVPGKPEILRGVQFVFHERAKRNDSFGAHLLGLLRTALRQSGIATVQSWASAASVPRLRADHYPIAWECRTAVQEAARARKFALCLNDNPPPGLSGGFVDAITTDDFSGGACAAELLKARTGTTTGLTAIAGPAADLRSQKRIAGFLSHAENARVEWAESWYVEAGRPCAATALTLSPAGIFACNDRLAQAVIEVCREQGRNPPHLVGFDDAPVAERLGLTTVGIPWSALIEQAVELITRRLEGTRAPAKLVCLSHEPVLRLTA